METGQNLLVEGTQIPLNIYVSPIGDIHLQDCNFQVLAYVSPYRKIAYRKEDMVKVDEDNYIVKMDSAQIGKGKLQVEAVVYLPDGRFPDNVRKEVVDVDCNIIIR